nr:65-kDa microtubule-associated protein 5 [Ipomoea batatas]
MASFYFIINAVVSSSFSLLLSELWRTYDKLQPAANMHIMSFNLQPSTFFNYYSGGATTLFFGLQICYVKLVVRRTGAAVPAAAVTTSGFFDWRRLCENLRSYWRVEAYADEEEKQEGHMRLLCCLLVVTALFISLLVSAYCCIHSNMVSELAGEGAVPPQLPAPASHAELRVCLQQSIRRGSLLSWQYVNPSLDSELDFFVHVGNKLAYATVEVIPNLSAVLLKSNQTSVSDDSWSRSMKNTSKVLVNVLFAGFNRSLWSRSAKCSSKVLVNRTSRSRFVKVLSKVLTSFLFTIFIRSRSAKISSAELVVVVSSPQRRTRKKKQLITPIHDFVFEKSQGERRVSDMKNRVGKLRSEIEAPTANIEEAMRFRGAVAEIDSWSRSMDTNLCSVFSKPEQVVLSCSLVTPPLAVLRLVLGSALTERLCQAISLISDMSSSSTFSSHSAMVNVCVEENEKSLIWIWLVLIAITCCESAVFVAILKKVDNASEVEDCIRTLEVLSLSILNWKLIVKRWHFQNLRKRIAEMSFVKREYESPMMTLWIVRYDFQCVLHIVCVDRVLTIDKENAQHKIASGLLCSNNSADKCVAVEFVSVEFIDVWEHVSEKIWIEAFCKSCWKWMHVNIEANVLRLFFRSAVGHMKEYGLSEELSQLLKFMESRLQLWFLDTSIEEQQRFDNVICLISSSVDEVLSQGSLANEVIELTEVEVEFLNALKCSKLSSFSLLLPLSAQYLKEKSLFFELAMSMLEHSDEIDSSAESVTTSTCIG